ncbi:lysozyme M1 (1,4-beta-N-acetylmuramidase M1) [Streptomyces himastatinicus ATCC 53653]|uniref:lysozyme n=2 Tax=Streptomyces violaceusniger group TaxID=2839105 RepID=D9W7I5_9ACTN|nr:lysozyme M1 (1,4-beta-N-acetylmuramidase M1) [Streptomyces himastatinicus ATCC 53653]
MGAAVGAAALATLVPAMASTTEPDTDSAPNRTLSASVPHPERDWMGSTLSAHEKAAPKAAPAATPDAATVEGVDVSNHQGSVNWTSLWNKNVRFAYVKATESTTYKNPAFSSQYNGAFKKGMIRGAYHFALPNKSSGSKQADFFVRNGGDWSNDGKTLPPVLDMEYNPYGGTCYGKTKAQMVGWIKDFSSRVKSLTGRDPVIYTTTSWWKSCTGNSGAFASKNPLWVARYTASPGALPAGWKTHTFWQYTSTGPVVGDHNRFNGSLTALKALAKG